MRTQLRSEMNINPAEDSRQDPQSSMKRKRTMSLSVVSRDTVVLQRGHTLPLHLMILLNEWHRENPTLQPPGSYRTRLTSRRESEIFSRTGEPLLECRVFVLVPVRYEMLVLYSEKQPAKFVSCIRIGYRTFFKEWLGKDRFEDRTCAVRVLIPSTAGSIGPLQQRRCSKLPISESLSEEHRLAQRLSLVMTIETLHLLLPVTIPT
ncbi:hypothetical protein VTN77DRAFT_3057 [Rasamsonia byssochlamydoides]|uniref:uncharacterized protein n=1 Tax=Rasamsonia byssochlamydoides TaxID=89139 RepID=UPI003742C111